MIDPDISVILTIRNVETTIRICLDSLLAQETDRTFEIIIIEAESTDMTPEIVREYARRDPRVRMIVKRSTQPEALNLGVREARAPMLAFIDGDCRADPRWLHELATKVAAGDPLVGGIVLTPPEIGGLGRVIGYDLDYRFLATPEGYVKRHPNMNLGGRRDVFDALGFNEKLPIGYDTDFGYRAGAAGHKIRFTKQALVYHYHRSTWKAFVRQQVNSVRFFLKTPRETRPRPTKDDNINPWWMQVQPLALALFGLGLIAVWFSATIGLALIALGSIPFVVPAAAAASRLRNASAGFNLLWFYPTRTMVWMWAFVTSPRGGSK